MIIYAGGEFEDYADIGKEEGLLSGYARAGAAGRDVAAVDIFGYAFVVVFRYGPGLVR